MGADSVPSRIVVSGGSSFLGRRLIQLLSAKGAEIAVVTRTEFRPHEHIDVGEVALALESGDERLVERLAEFQPGGVVHMAAAGGLAASIDDLPSLVDASVVLGARLLEVTSRSGGASFVSIGSFSERAVEGKAIVPASLYSATKSALMPYVQYYAARRGVNCVALQPTDIYGEGDWRRRFLDLVVEAVRSGDPLEATGGEQIVSFVHVDDVCAAIAVALATKPVDPGELPVECSVAGPEIGPLRDLVETTLAELSIDVSIEWGARAYRDNEVMEPALLPILPGWQPLIPLSEGFTRLLAHSSN